jgi:hypothetical protein
MNIRDIPGSLADYTAFVDDYEARHLARTPAAERLMAATAARSTACCRGPSRAPDRPCSTSRCAAPPAPRHPAAPPAPRSAP